MISRNLTRCDVTFRLLDPTIGIIVSVIDANSDAVVSARLLLLLLLQTNSFFCCLHVK